MARANHIGSLESLRGIAALTVCFFHAGYVPYQGGLAVPRGSWLDVLLNGHGAVILFFVLSGFVLRGALGRMSGQMVRDFVVARLFRLFPVIVATVALFMVVLWLVDGTTPDLMTFVRNALLLEFKINGAFWTLQVEVFGSLLVLVAYLVERRFGLGPVYALTLVSLAISFGGDSSRIVWQYLDINFFYPFLVGFLAATLSKPVFGRWALAALGLAVIVFFGAHAIGYVLKQWLLLATVLSSALMVLVLSEDRFRDAMQSAPLRLLGLWSYSFYALHPLGLMVATGLAVRMDAAGAGRPAVIAVALASAALVATFAAAPFYYWVERPGIWLGRRLLYATKPLPAL
jgi:peptidoglycan/LPS O-acetylase OafA/YrhL